MKIRKCVGQGQIHRCCMSLKVEASSNQALVIKVNGVILKFTIRTFALITGLNYVDVVEDFKFNTEEPNRLIFSTLVVMRSYVDLICSIGSMVKFGLTMMMMRLSLQYYISFICLCTLARRDHCEFLEFILIWLKVVGICIIRGAEKHLSGCYRVSTRFWLLMVNIIKYVECLLSFKYGYTSAWVSDRRILHRKSMIVSPVF